MSLSRWLALLGATVALILVVSACGNSRSVLYSGVTYGLSNKPIVITDAAALRDAREILHRWLDQIARRGREAPGQRFSNLPGSELRQRLAAAAARYHFTVKRVRLLHPRQVAPLVILQTRDYVAVGRAVPAIETSLDPQNGRGWKDMAFEAFFLEVQDERGVPFITTNYAVRGHGSYGGMWARANALLPSPGS
ncbi:MAG TPA: hypothetical protein VKR79_12055 [Gaiellaceae bacterium]|nr:hypothetical protein [Gaiellaceae bacterium]